MHATTEIKQQAPKSVLIQRRNRRLLQLGAKIGEVAALRGAHVQEGGYLLRVLRARPRSVAVTLAIEHAHTHAFAAADPLTI